MTFTDLDATFNVAQQPSTAGIGFPDWNQTTEYIVKRCLAGERRFRLELRIFGTLLTRGRGNDWVKATDPVTCQRISGLRTESDIITPFYRKINPDTGRPWGYDSTLSNMGNTLIVPLVDMKDMFGNLLKRNVVYQANGNTGLVAICQIANGEVKLPKGCDSEDWLPEEDETLDFEVIAISSIHQLEKYYDNIDSTYSAKSKDDNYSSILVGNNLVDYETGETDLVRWTTESMDGAFNLITGGSIPKNIRSMNNTVTPYLPIIKNVKEETSSVIKHTKSNKTIFKAFCLDLTSLETYNRVSPLLATTFWSNLVNTIQDIVKYKGASTIDYWENRFFTGKKVKNVSKIQTDHKSFEDFIVSDSSSWTQFHFTIEDWIVWELFAIDREVKRDIKDHNLYGHGGSQVVGGKDRKNAAYQSLNYLRVLYLYAVSIGFKKRFTAQQAFEWASQNVSLKLSAVTEPRFLSILSDKKVREALKAKIY